MSNQLRGKEGFSLIEVLVVIAIIGMLATSTLVGLSGAQAKTRDVRRLADLQKLQTGLELCRIDSCTGEYARYPDASSLGHWANLAEALSAYKLSVVPFDPVNDGSQYYVYATNDDRTEYVLGTKLETADHDSLSGDEDTVYFDYVAADGIQYNSSKWTTVNTLESTSIPGTLSIARDNNANVSVNCQDTAGYYCISE